MCFSLVFISRQTGATEHQILDVRAGQRTSETSEFSTGQRLIACGPVFRLGLKTTARLSEDGFSH